jgi:hypothetical protein
MKGFRVFSPALDFDLVVEDLPAFVSKLESFGWVINEADPT